MFVEGGWGAPPSLKKGKKVTIEKHPKTRRRLNIGAENILRDHAGLNDNITLSLAFGAGVFTKHPIVRFAGLSPNKMRSPHRQSAPRSEYRILSTPVSPFARACRQPELGQAGHTSDIVIHISSCLFGPSRMSLCSSSSPSMASVVAPFETQEPFAARNPLAFCPASCRKWLTSTCTTFLAESSNHIFPAVEDRIASTLENIFHSPHTEKECDRNLPYRLRCQWRLDW
ncbi:hypothetical protein R3P38DRAFT_3364981 [Favolaschia claudopus]|uniref:Uncharacterized protein n=1 Tax=Favolaschia claudopus TaxID=2862362 RepID=A0AAW0AJY9_9AGAR